MISINDAVGVVKEKTGEKILQVSDYNKDYYLVLAEGSSPYYIVDKSNGKSRVISPLEDFKNFVDAINNKILKRF